MFAKMTKIIMDAIVCIHTQRGICIQPKDKYARTSNFLKKMLKDNLFKITEVITICYGLVLRYPSKAHM